MREPNHARRQRCVDEDGESKKSSTHYAGDADEDEDNEQEYWAEDDDAWYHCDEGYCLRDTATAQEFDAGEFDGPRD
eukprot:4546078-Pyramimonas_sp.AAC.1